MKPTDDQIVDASPKLESNLNAYFEHLWRHLDAHETKDALEKPTTDEDEPRGKVRLDCTGEVVDMRSIGVAVVRNSHGVESVEFLCPRCERLHESLAVR